MTDGTRRQERRGISIGVELKTRKKTFVPVFHASGVFHANMHSRYERVAVAHVKNM
jgi:hypothetical protein